MWPCINCSDPSPSWLPSLERASLEHLTGRTAMSGPVSLGFMALVADETTEGAAEGEPVYVSQLEQGLGVPRWRRSGTRRRVGGLHMRPNPVTLAFIPSLSVHAMAHYGVQRLRRKKRVI